MAKISLENVSLDYPIYNSKSFSLKNKLLNIATGGRILGNNSGVNIVRALSNINLNIHEGDRVGIIGHNGSGKTTLLRCLAGIYHPTSGYIQRVGKVGSYIEIGAGIQPELTGYSNIKRLLMLRGVYDKKEINKLREQIIHFSELHDFVNLPVRTYSAGMQTRLIFSTITAQTPEILIVDEFFGAGDIDFQKKANERLINNFNKVSILVLASHDLSLLKRMCNRFFVLQNGQIEETDLINK